jgi:hypothetical protein
MWGQPWLAWTASICITWAQNEELEKLLGAVFGLSLIATDLDEFLKDKIIKKLGYWYHTKIHVTKRGVIVNGVLLSMAYFFLAIWGGLILEFKV